MSEEQKIQADVEGAGEGEEGKKLTAGQKKKLKEKQKKEAAAKLAAELAAAGGAPAEEKKPDAKGGKKKPMNAAAKAALEKKALLEEIAKQQAEEDEKIRLKEEEEERLANEEKNRENAAQKAKKQAENDKKEELKKQGKWKTKKQLEKERAQERKRQELIASGKIKEDDVEEGEEDQKKQSSMIKRNKNKDKRKKPDGAEAQTQENQNPVQSTQPVKKEEEVKQIKSSAVKEDAKKEESDDVLSDWENEDLDDLAGNFAQALTANPIEIKEEDNMALLSKEEVKKVDQGPTKSGGGAKKKAKKDEEGGEIEKGYDDKDKEARKKKRQEMIQAQIASRNAKKNRPLRCPIVCILGHVDTGKTKILDKLRKTNVQGGEAGGITQQIGATHFPKDYIQGHVEKMNAKIDLDLKIPGFLIIDTPGHESFTNLRSRGSSLCDVAILVVDLMHALEQQTRESIELLRQKKCPFIIALNKVDRCYEWKSEDYRNFRDSLAVQATHTQNEFQERMNTVILEFAEEGFNVCPYWENTNTDEYVSLVPTSAITGEGLPDLMAYLSQTCQERISRQLQERDDFECTVLEVKVIEGLGTTIDVTLVNGVLKVQDTIVVQGLNGPIVTQIRALLTPQPMKEMRVKGEYVHHQKIKGAMGIKISAPGLEQAIAGAELIKANGQEEIDAAVEEIKENMYDIMDKYVDKTRDGVCVQASTLGSLEALLEFLLTSKIPVCNIAIGPVHKKDIAKATKILGRENEKKIMKEYACVLAFDVPVTKDAVQFAEEEGVKIFTAKIIYHLFDEFTAYVKECQDNRKNDGGTAAIFPCTVEVVKDAVFRRNGPIILGVIVTAGQLRIGTPLCVPDKENLKIGVVESIEQNGKSVTKILPKDGNVAVRIGGQSNVTYGRQFDDSNQIASWQNRRSIDSLKTFYRDEMSQDDWKLIKKLKTIYKIE